MEVKQFTKRPLTVEAFRFDAKAALRQLNPRNARTAVGLATLVWRGGDVWHVYNPGRESTLEGPWQRVHHGDYIIIAPTGCRYPVQADQFERNYGEAMEAPMDRVERWARTLCLVDGHDPDAVPDLSISEIAGRYSFVGLRRWHRYVDQARAGIAVADAEASGKRLENA